MEIVVDVEKCRLERKKKRSKESNITYVRRNSFNIAHSYARHKKAPLAKEIRDQVNLRKRKFRTNTRQRSKLITTTPEIRLQKCSKSFVAL